MSLILLDMSAVDGLSSVVDTIRLSLDASSACWWDVVKYAGYAVAIGCALEVPETCVIMRRWWLARFKNDVREETLKDKRSWIIPFAAVGLIVIVAGIVVETFAEGKVSDIDAAIRTHESAVLTAAEDRATRAEIGLRRYIDVIAEPRRIVLSDRDGDANKRAYLFKGIQKFAGTHVLIQWRPGGLDDPRLLAIDIASRLHEAGWNVQFTDEAHSGILNDRIEDGVQFVTIATISDIVNGSRNKLLEPSHLSGAAQAAVALFQLDLGPPYGSPLGVISQYDAEIARGHFLIAPPGFRWPANTILVFVGQKPIFGLPSVLNAPGIPAEPPK